MRNPLATRLVSKDTFSTDGTQALHFMSCRWGPPLQCQRQTLPADCLIVFFILAYNARLVPAFPASRSAEPSVELIAAMSETLLMLG